jgi:signal transduction histidine kinase
MLNQNNNESRHKELELLNEKLQRNEKILIQAYKSLKDKELKLKQLNEDLLASEEELRQTNEKLFEANELLVTQKNQLEIALSELQKTQLQLIQSEKMASLGVLANGIAHEINNPLNFINGGILGLETYFNENLVNHIENVAPLMEAIKTGIVRSALIVRSLDQYSHANKTELINCDIHAIINNCLVLLQSKLESRIEVVKNYTPIPYNLIGCEGNLLQLFLNIIKNSIQAISSKGTISITTKVEKTDLIISITDTGCGISPENLTKIFDPFFTTKDPGKGTGLGLSITYKIIQEHKGTIEYKTELGTGTTATIKLPIVVE